jgi:1,4-dihydroxy-2-naphthoate octaprenyltransferase
MPNIKEQEFAEYRYTCCDWRQWCKGRFSGIRFGILLVVIGLFWHGSRAGWFPTEWLHSDIFWPSVMIFIGVWILLRSVFKRKRKVVSDIDNEHT